MTGPPTPPGSLLYDSPAGPDPDGIVVLGTPPMEIWDGDTVWLPCKMYPTAGKAKMGALYGLFDMASFASFIELRCRREWMRAEARYEDGYRLDSWADEMWYPCSPADEGAHCFWRIEAK